MKKLINNAIKPGKDYECNKFVMKCGTYEGKTVRMVQCYDKYRRDYQVGRYQSGMYFTRTATTIKDDLKYDFFKPSDECKAALAEYLLQGV